MRQAYSSLQGVKHPLAFRSARKIVTDPSKGTDLPKGHRLWSSLLAVEVSGYQRPVLVANKASRIVDEPQ